jgi:hypothetical protein
MTSGKIVDTVDVSDICDDVDEVVIFDDEPGRYRARAFVETDLGDMTEVLVDLREYPAVVAVCRRAFDVRDRVIFEPLPTAELGDGI